MKTKCKLDINHLRPSSARALPYARQMETYPVDASVLEDKVVLEWLRGLIATLVGRKRSKAQHLMERKL